MEHPRWVPRVGEWVVVERFPTSLYKVQVIYPNALQLHARHFSAEGNVSLWVHECRPATPTEIAAKVAERLQGISSFHVNNHTTFSGPIWEEVL